MQAQALGQRREGPAEKAAATRTWGEGFPPFFLVRQSPSGSFSSSAAARKAGSVQASSGPRASLSSRKWVGSSLSVPTGNLPAAPGPVTGPPPCPLEHLSCAFLRSLMARSFAVTASDTGAATHVSTSLEIHRSLRAGTLLSYLYHPPPLSDPTSLTH